MQLEGYISNIEQGLDKNGKVVYFDNLGNKIDLPKAPLGERIGNQLKAINFNVDSWLNRSDYDEDVRRQKLDLILGLATMPIGAGAKITSGLASKLMPYLGKKMANTISTSALSGGFGNATYEGLESAFNGENPLLGATKGFGTGALGGGAFGLGIGKASKFFDRRNVLKNNTPEYLQQYFNNYVEGLDNNAPIGRQSLLSKEMADFRGLRNGVNNGGYNVLLDKISQNDFRNWFGESKIVDEQGNPKLFVDNDNVYITDGYSNNGISKYTYKGGHRAPSYSYGDVLERIDNSDDVNLAEIAQGYHNQPKDYFSAMGPRYYGYNDTEGIESLNAIRRAIHGAKTVKAYRAVPNDVNSDVLNNGDWVTLSKKYAEVHGDSNLDGNYKIIEQDVPTNHLWWDGNDIREFGYDNGLPNKPDIMVKMENPYNMETLPNDWMEARKISNDGYDGIITNDGKYLVFGKDQLKRTSDVDGNINLYDKLVNPKQLLKKPKLGGKMNYIKDMTKEEFARVTSEFNTNLSAEERNKKFVAKAVGNYYYKARNNGFNDYKFIGRYLIDDLYD